jgi:hypothetical protein
MIMKKIKRTDENKKEVIYNTIKEASASIDTNMDDWKVQMLIVNAINTKGRAFKCRWVNVD